MRTLKVEVTNQDIVCGLPHDEWSCPVARALCRAIGKDENDGGGNVEVLDYDAMIFMRDEEDTILSSCRVPLPAAARRFISEFDESEGESGQPFSFDVEVPECV